MNARTRKVLSLCSVTLLVCLQGLILSATAQIRTLTDANSTAQINVGSQAGMYTWTVDGVNQLYQQWFWYRVGGAGQEFSIDTLGAPILVQNDARTLYATYTSGSFSVEVDYLLTGATPGSGRSDITESIRIHNSSASPLDFHFFQYSDFDLLGTAGGDSVQLFKSGRGLWNEALQTKGPVMLSESWADTVDTPGATHGEVALFPVTRGALNDALPTTLNDNGGALGPGDVTWAFEWDVTIGPGDTFLISKDKNLQVPEPSVLGLISLGLIGYALRVRRERP